MSLVSNKLGVTSELILTAGPHITYKEVEYASDAALNGWNRHHSDYIKTFENTFANYVGVKRVISTSSCTGALHLSMLALGIGPGDEVIVPEITWIATAAAVKYVGATPIFADIEKDTWNINPDSIEKLITPRTKLIVAVHLYGHPADMDPIHEIAKKHNIFVMEDAAQSIGAEYKGIKTGKLAKIAAFSFQGAKALVTGEGGILVTDDDEIMDRAWFYNDHCRDVNKALYNIGIGYKYKLSNIQAAIGLAQVQNVENIIAKKIEIFKWYQERLADINEIQINVEKNYAKNIFWMSSIILGDKVPYERDEFILKLKEQNIDTRPFFYPISSFPMFKDQQVNNPVAYKIPLRGINLPSGHDRTEEEIDYICAHIRNLIGKGLGTKISTQQPHGWLSYRDNVNNAIQKAKLDKTISLELLDNNKLGHLTPITQQDIKNDSLIKQLEEWRRVAQESFPAQFTVTFEGTRAWLQNQVIDTKDRILFMVEDNKNNAVGHIGLFRFDYIKKACELDNVVRGVQNVFPGAMTYACRSILDWAFNKLEMETVYLRVLSDNPKAIKLYEKIGFKEIQRVPLMKVEEEGRTRWIDAILQPYTEIKKYFVTMKLTRQDFKNLCSK